MEATTEATDYSNFRNLLDITDAARLGMIGLRSSNPRARAQSEISRYGTSRVRRYYCNFCERLVDTESARWPPTKHAQEACDRHMFQCQSIEKYVRIGIVFLLKLTSEQAAALDNTTLAALVRTVQVDWRIGPIIDVIRAVRNAAR